jgi:hypothetical protein
LELCRKKISEILSLKERQEEKLGTYQNLFPPPSAPHSRHFSNSSAVGAFGAVVVVTVVVVVVVAVVVVGVVAVEAVAGVGVDSFPGIEGEVGRRAFVGGLGLGRGGGLESLDGPAIVGVVAALGPAISAAPFSGIWSTRASNLGSSIFLEVTEGLG